MEPSLIPSASAIESGLFALIFNSAGLLTSQQSLWGSCCSVLSELSDCQHGINFPFCACSHEAVEKPISVLFVQSV